MWELNKKEFDKRLKKIQKLNTQKMYRAALREEKNKLSKKGKVETSKLIAIYLIILLNSIIVYSMVAMWVFADLSYLGVLISDIAAQVLIYAIYCMKAYYGKKQEEIMKLERDKVSGSLSDILDAGSKSNKPVPLTTGEIDVNTDTSDNWN